MDWNPNWNRSKLESDWNLVGRTPQILARSNWNSWNIGILESNLEFGIRIPIWTSESNFQADRTTFKARHLHTWWNRSIFTYTKWIFKPTDWLFNSAFCSHAQSRHKLIKNKRNARHESAVRGEWWHFARGDVDFLTRRAPPLGTRNSPPLFKVRENHVEK